jgi:acetyl-CoA acetyltransferase
MKRCAIIGMGMITGLQEGKTPRLLEAEATRLAIKDAGIKNSDVNGAMQLRRTGGGGERAVLTDAYPRVLGLPVNFYYTVGRGGCVAGLAVAQAISFLNLGIADYVVLTGAVDDKSRANESKKQGFRGMKHMEKEGYYAKPFGDLIAPSHHSFFASRHMHEYGTTSEQFGAISVQQRQWAQKNPQAFFYGRPITIEDHQNSPYIVEPYHLLDICLVSDGAVSVVMTTEDRAKDAKNPPVWVSGIGFGEVMAELWWEKKNYTTLAVKTAKEQALRQAGITLDDIDCAQLYDCFTGEVLFQLEDYGWCEKGEGGAFVEAGNIGPGGRIPVNTSGGLLSAYHFGDLTGLSEAVMQIRGEAGERQIENCEFALVTGHGGEVLSPAMCSIHSSLILGRN